MSLMRWIVWIAVSASLGGCGGGGGGAPGVPGPAIDAVGGPGVDLDGLAQPEVLLLTISGHDNAAVPLSSAGNGTYLDDNGSAGPKVRALLEGLGLTVVERHFADRLRAPDADGDRRADAPDRLGFLECLSVLEQAGRLWIDGQALPTAIVLVAHSHGANWAHLVCEAAAGRVAPGPLPIRVLVSLDGVLTAWDGEHQAQLQAWWDRLPERTFRGLRLARDPSTATNAIVTDQGLRHVKDVVWPNVRFAYEVMSADLLGPLLSDVVRNVPLNDFDLVPAGDPTGTTIWTRDTRAGVLLVNGTGVAPEPGDAVVGETHGGVHDASGPSIQWVCDRLSERFGS